MNAVATPVPRLADRTPLDWRDLLVRRLNQQAVDAAVYEDYYDGRHPLQFATSKYREAFGHLFGAFADNWCQLIVDAPVERLAVVGFEVGGKPSSDAWTVWQANGLDLESVIAHTEAGKAGSSFLLVDPNDGEPQITIEHASQVIVVRDPADRRKRLAAFKRWLGDDGFVYATLYLPDVVYKWESEERAVDTSQASPASPWQPRDPGAAQATVKWVDRSDADPETPNSLGVVPVIPLESKPGLIGGGHSDLEPAIPLQNAVNKLCTDMIVASEYGAFRQRVLTGVETPKDPETGQPLAAVELKAAMSRLWTFKPADAKVWDLNPTDLMNFVNAIEMYVQHLAAQTRTPPHYLLAKLVNTSGDALSVAEAGLVSKCKSKRLAFSDPWEEAIALCLNAVDDGELDSSDCESIWASPERVTQSALVDAAVKKKTLAIPLPVIWLELGYTPEQIEQMKEDELAALEAELEAAAAREALAEKANLALQTTPAPAEPATTPPLEPGQEPVPTVPPPEQGGTSG